MGLDSRYVIAPSLEMYFVNKDTGLPLVNGSVVFYEDQARTIPKPVYKLSGSPPNYSYDVLPNPSQLSGVGTFQDNNGNDIIPYYFPFDANGNIELYYIEVYDSLGVLQFTREGWPNFVDENVDSNQDVTNFVPNGQFLAHLDIPATSANNFNAGEISATSTPLGQGGWSFDRSNNTATDIITFLRYPSTQDPTGNPRYAVQIETTTIGSESYKDLRLKFNGVNTFASTTQEFNLYFEGESATGSDITGVRLVLIKNFGTGGSPTTEEIIDTFTLSASSISSFNIPILFGDNSSKSIPADDDYLQLAIRFPSNTSFTAVLTDFAITVNNEELTQFPTETHAEQIGASTAGWLPVPNPDGSDMYLPIILTQTGFDYDRSVIGTIETSLSTTNTYNNLLCDGTSYLGAAYSSLGIPYYRLRDFLISKSPVANTPLFGTGANFANAYAYIGATNVFRITNNKNGAGAVPCSDVGTGWVYIETRAGSASINLKAFNNTTNTLMINGIGFITPFAAINAGTSGFSVATQSNATGYTAQQFYTATVATVSAAALTTGSGNPAKYFKVSNSTTTYYFWYDIQNEIDPTPGGTGIKITIPTTTATAQDVCNITLEAVNAYEITTIGVSVLPPPGSYFLLTTNPGAARSFYVWFAEDGVGTDPAVAGKTGIKVDYLSTDTTAQMTTKTITAINKYQFQVPDLRGMFLRYVDTTALIDVDVIARFSTVTGILGAFAGTYEYSQIIHHNHTGVDDISVGTNPSTNTVGNEGATNTGTFTSTLTIDATGGNETRPINFGVTYFIKY